MSGVKLRCEAGKGKAKEWWVAGGRRISASRLPLRPTPISPDRMPTSTAGKMPAATAQDGGAAEIRPAAAEWLDGWSSERRLCSARSCWLLGGAGALAAESPGEEHDELLCNYQGTIKGLLRDYQGTIRVLLRYYQETRVLIAWQERIAGEGLRRWGDFGSVFGGLQSRTRSKFLSGYKYSTYAFFSERITGALAAALLSQGIAHWAASSRCLNREQPGLWRSGAERSGERRAAGGCVRWK